MDIVGIFTPDIALIRENGSLQSMVRNYLPEGQVASLPEAWILVQERVFVAMGAQTSEGERKGTLPMICLTIAL